MGTIFPLRMKKCRRILHSPSIRRPNGESDRLFIHLWIEEKTLLRGKSVGNDARAVVVPVATTGSKRTGFEIRFLVPFLRRQRFR